MAGTKNDAIVLIAHGCHLMEHAPDGGRADGNDVSFLSQEHMRGVKPSDLQ